MAAALLYVLVDGAVALAEFLESPPLSARKQGAHKLHDDAIMVIDVECRESLRGCCLVIQQPCEVIARNRTSIWTRPIISAVRDQRPWPDLSGV